MIYLDNAATTKPLFTALKSAEQYNGEMFFNPSALYRGGIDVKVSIEKSRNEISKMFPENYEVIFTSCGSESDNIAVFSSTKRGNFITTEGEHSAVYESFSAIKKRGGDVRFAKLNKDGSVNEESLLSIIDDKTTFVSVVHVNNETGAINDINRLAKIVKQKNSSIIFHSDGVQAFGKIAYRISQDIDLYSISAHKIGGIKGVGALIKKKKINITPLIYGGGQEGGLRSGTENVYGITVFAEATKSHFQTIDDDYKKVVWLKNLFVSKLDDNIQIISSANASPYIVSISAVGLRGEVIQHMLENYDIIVGTGSACSSRHRHSRILQACGYSSKILDGAIRISFCNETNEDEVLFATEKINECVNKLKGIMCK